tara:strand:+ start:8634 stop:9164 length:531 start_codon:yes stop_codon:yes gene_type:complete
MENGKVLPSRVQNNYERTRSYELKPYFEPVSEWNIKFSKGQLAFVEANATLHTYGVPRRNNMDFFTLIIKDDDWRIFIISYTSTPLSDDENVFNMVTFDRSYTRVLSGVRPEFVAKFFKENGTLQLNENQPTVGRSQIVEMAKSLMHGLQNMVVNYDSLVTKSTATEFQWALTGTN